MTCNNKQPRGKITMFFLKKIILGFAAIFLIFVGGSGTQSNSLFLQGGGFIGLIVGLVVLYIFMKMAWRAMGCIPSFLVFTAIVSFILYAIGAFNNGILGVGETIKTFLGQQANSKQEVPSGAALNLLDDDKDYNQAYAPTMGEGFSSDEEPVLQSAPEPQVPSKPQPQPQAQKAQKSGIQQLMSSFSGQPQEQESQGFDPTQFPAIYGQVRVINGDTLQMNGKYMKLYGVDAPESNQTCADRSGRSYACGNQAALWLKSWLADNTIECRVMQQDAKGNMVGVCSLGQYDIGAAMVNAGWAVTYLKYTDIYAPYEQQAKAENRGLWQGQFYMPWDWRTLQARKPKIKIIKPKSRKKGILDL